MKKRAFIFVLIALFIVTVMPIYAITGERLGNMGSAEIYLPDNFGVRYIGYVSQEKISKLENSGAKNLKYGFVVAPTDLILNDDGIPNYDSLTLKSKRNGMRAVAVPAQIALDSSENEVKFTAVIKNLGNEFNINLFSARVYLQYELDGVLKTEYAEKGSTCSLYEAAKMALNKSATGFSVLNNRIYEKEFCPCVVFSHEIDVTKYPYLRFKVDKTDVPFSLAISCDDGQDIWVVGNQYTGVTTSVNKLINLKNRFSKSGTHKISVKILWLTYESGYACDFFRERSIDISELSFGSSSEIFKTVIATDFEEGAVTFSPYRTDYSVSELEQIKTIIKNVDGGLLYDGVETNTGKAITIFSGVNYTGSSMILTEGVHSISSIPFEISSVTIPKNKELSLYRKSEYGGGVLKLNYDQNDLTQSGWTANISQITVGNKSVYSNEVEQYPFLIGTQDFGGLYQFGDGDIVYEVAQRIKEMGSNTIKTIDSVDYDKIIKDLDFTNVYLWTLTDQYYWQDGLSTEESNAVYKYMYGITKHLLTEYNNTGKKFYLGHWEGDWYYIPNSDITIKDIDAVRTQGMIDWLNIRQKAIDDAKKDIEYNNVSVWGYTEINRVADAMDLGYDRVVNAVLPYVSIDYVSYSAYDTQGSSKERTGDIMEYIRSNIKNDRNVPGERVWIGEICIPAKYYGYDEERHNRENIEAINNYIMHGADNVLYWTMYNNELDGDEQRGFWLIDDNGKKWKIYYSYKSYYDSSKEYLTDYYAQNGKLPNSDTFRIWTIDFLNTLI